MEHKLKIKQNSDLIAPFMGMRKGMADYHSKSDGQYECFYDDLGLFGDPRQAYTDYSLKFDSSWEWLMKVVEKISKTKGIKIELNYLLGGLQVKINLSNYSKWPNPNHIEAVYSAVLDFIVWYNKSKKVN